MIRQLIRVLIADDGPAVRRVLSVFLADADDMTIVGEAECGRDAAEMIERLHPDVALINCTMPDLEGMEVVRLAKALPGSVGLVVLDTYGERALAAVEAGADAHLLQENLRERLLDTIRRSAKPPPAHSPATHSERLSTGPYAGLSRSYGRAGRTNFVKGSPRRVPGGLAAPPCGGAR